MRQLLASRLVRAAALLAASIALALLVMQFGFTESRLRLLTWPTAPGADTLYVSIFATWRGSADDSAPRRIKVLSSAPGAEAIWTYVDPATLHCFETTGDGALKGAPLGDLSPALLRNRLPALPGTIDTTALNAGIAEIDACIRRIATDGASGMIARAGSARPEGDPYAPTLEFPNWWTFPGSGGEAAYVEPGPFFAALAIAGAGILAAGAVLIWPRCARPSPESEPAVPRVR